MEKTMHYPILTELQLATKWNISNKTLGRWRATNQGPTWYKLFRHIRYREIDVIDFERRSAERLSTVLGREISSNHFADTASINAVTNPLVPIFEFQNKLVTSKEVAALTNLPLHIFLDPKERDKKKIPAIKLIGIVRFSIDEIFRWELENSTSCNELHQRKTAANDEIQAFIAHSKLQAIPTGPVPRWYESLHQINRTKLTTTTIKSGSP